MADQYRESISDIRQWCAYVTSKTRPCRSDLYLVEMLRKHDLMCADKERLDDLEAVLREYPDLPLGFDIRVRNGLVCIWVTGPDDVHQSLTLRAALDEALERDTKDTKGNVQCPNPDCDGRGRLRDAPNVGCAVCKP